VTAPIVRLRGVAIGFADGSRTRMVLDGFDLDVAQGETLAVCGPSGSGKSTLLNLIAGLVVPDRGEVQVNVGTGGHALERMNAAARAAVRRRHFGIVFQFFNLLPTLTVPENVLLPLELNQREELRDVALARLARLGLEGRANDFPDRLSGGEQQRVAVARALAHQPAVVLADEPTGNLDHASAEAVTGMLFAEATAAGACLIVATHSASVAARASRRVQLAG
jgi:putative ABC transport system ATP-binding protein